MSDRKYDPRGRIEISLDVHSEAPKDVRPTFTYQRLSTRQYNELSDSFDAVERDANWTKEKEKEAYDKVIARLFAVAGFGLLDWNNQVDLETGDSLPFACEHLSRVINPSEARELAVKRISGAHVTADDKKKLG